jgi:hypothetical protein
MFKLSSELAICIAVRHGIVTAEALIVDGVTLSSIRSAVAAKLLLRAHNGVYRLATSPDSFEARCVAASLADPTSFVTGVSAARLWEFRSVFHSDVPVVTCAHHRNPFARDVTVRRCGDIEAGDFMTRRDGIRLAVPARAWFDCACDLHDEKFEAMTEWVIDHHCSVETLWQMGRRLARSGRPGSAVVSRVMSTRADWQRPADSGLELRVLSALERAGIGPLVRQHPICLPNGIWVHPDGVDLDVKWAVEVDHVTWHGGRLKAQQDKGRDRALRKIGWQVDRVTDQELADDFAGHIRELVELHALRAASSAFS